MKGCMARKLVERSPAKPGVLIVTYMAEHCHPVPTQLNALAGTIRHTKSASVSAAGEDRPAASSSPKSHEQRGPVSDEAARCDAESINEASTAPVTADQCGGAEEAAAGLADDEGEFWPAEMDLDELLATVDDDLDFEPVMNDDDGSRSSNRWKLVTERS
jgi:WRKY transcription factor 22